MTGSCRSCVSREDGHTAVAVDAGPGCGRPDRRHCAGVVGGVESGEDSCIGARAAAAAAAGDTGAPWS
jgi:hypothetical protein